MLGVFRWRPVGLWLAGLFYARGLAEQVSNVYTLYQEVSMQQPNRNGGIDVMVHLDSDQETMLAALMARLTDEHGRPTKMATAMKWALRKVCRDLGLWEKEKKVRKR